MSKKEFRNWSKMHNSFLNMHQLKEGAIEEEKDSWKYISQEAQLYKESD